jgi:hypothetical protein
MMIARMAGIAVGLALACVPALAEGWQEYAYPEYAFAVSFPADPMVTDTMYPAAGGTMAQARTYSVAQDGGVFSMIVADLSKSGDDEDSAIGAAVKSLAAKGEVKVDLPARVNRVYGRQLSIVGADGSHSTVALFFHQHRLYRIEGTVLPSNADAASGEAIRFQQSLRFTGDGASLLGLGAIFGFNR